MTFPYNAISGAPVYANGDSDQYIGRATIEEGRIVIDIQGYRGHETLLKILNVDLHSLSLGWNYKEKEPNHDPLYSHSVDGVDGLTPDMLRQRPTEKLTCKCGIIHEYEDLRTIQLKDTCICGQIIMGLAFGKVMTDIIESIKNNNNDIRKKLGMM